MSRMTGVILAAGMARRLRPLTDERPKCLLEVGGKTLLQRTIEAMLAAGVSDLTVVTGYRHEMLEAYVGSLRLQVPVTFFNNVLYEHNNNIYSLWMAMHGVRGREFLLMDSDILCDPAAVSRVARQEGTALALCRHELGEEEMKIVVDDRMRITQINKTCRPADAIGESVGIEKFTAAYSQALASELDRMILVEGLVNVFYEQAFERLIPQGHTFTVVDTSDLFSYELDTPDDYYRAQQLWPPTM